MTTPPVFYDDGLDRFVWCVDERGSVRIWPLAAFHGLDHDKMLATWGWRYATEAEVTGHLSTLRVLRSAT